VDNSYLFYTCVLLAATILAFISQFFIDRNKILSQVFFVLSFIILWYVSANRYGIGTDYKLYENMYYEITSISTIKEGLHIFSYVEPGWVLFNYIVKYAFNNVQYIFTISSLFTIGLSYLFIFKNRKNINIGITVFIFICLFYNQSFNVVRQSLAMSISIFSYIYMKERKCFKFFLTVGIAFCFHYSAILLLLIYPIFRSIETLPKIKKYIYITIVVCLFSYNSILNLVIKITGLTKYSIYYTDGIKISFHDILFKALIVIFIIINLNRLKKQNNYIYKLSNVYFIGVLLSLTSFFAPYIGRISYYFDMTLLLIIPNIIKTYSQKNGVIVYYLSLIFFYGYYFYYFLYLNYGETNLYIKLLA